MCVVTKWFLRSASHRHGLLYERSALLPFSHRGFEIGTRGWICTSNLRLLRPAPLLVGLRGRSYEMVPPVGIAPTWAPLQEEYLATIRSRRILKLVPTTGLAPALDTLSTCCLCFWATWALFLKWHFRLDLNQQPCASKALALPIELRKRSLIFEKSGTRWRTASARSARRSVKRNRRSGEAG